MDALEFLSALYETAPAGAGVMELRALKNSGGFENRVFTDNNDDIRLFSQRYRSTSPVGTYYGVALRTGTPRLNEATGRIEPQGKKTDIAAITALWADVDVVKMGWDMDRTLGLVKGHELRPSAIVNSGNGLHLYWCLRAPVVLPNASGPFVENVEGAMARLAEVFGGDNTHDITRVLRLPGSWNTKGDKPKQVKVAMADWREYALEELNDGAQDTNSLIDGPGFITREQMKEKVKQAKAEAGIVTLANDMVGGRKFKSLDDIWRHTKYKGDARITAFIGLDEAILRATAWLYARKPFWTDDQIVDAVLFEVRQIKDKQAPTERWDWEQERREIKDKLARYKARWKAFAEQRSKENGRPVAK